MDLFSQVANAHPNYIDNLYHTFLEDRTAVEPDWQLFFQGFDFAMTHANGQATSSSVSSDELKVFALIEDYRRKSHLLSDTNPIRPRKDRKPFLQFSDLGLQEADLQKRFKVGEILGLSNPTLQEIINRLTVIYTGKIGFEYTYVENPEERRWLQERIENPNRIAFDEKQKRRILDKLTETAVFENFLNKKYVGQKRFSLEGGESAIPAVDGIINKGADLGVEEIVIGMAHRGRLNVLANIMGKTYEHIFNEFEGQAEPDLTMGDGDVKYHLGYSSLTNTINNKQMYLKLMPNPSHLECVGSVVLGYTRAKADALYQKNYQKILPILIHGDAAVAGQGVVYEVAQMSQLEGYYTGGTIHFVINNQIGFTTDFDDARSSTYSTASAAITQAPVFHVNGDDVESVVFCAQLATEYRQTFNKDVYVDMVCYRLHGHNEGDDPKYTQPQMYNLIKNHPDPRALYVNKLTDSGEINSDNAQQINDEFWGMLQDRLDKVKEKPLPYEYQEPEIQWRKLRKNVRTEEAFPSPTTSIKADELQTIIQAIGSYPEQFNPLKKIKKLLHSQQELLTKEKKIDWAAAELLAYASLLLEGHTVRMSGQDVKRGTFSHRHAVLFDEINGQKHNRLNAIQEGQALFEIYNSLLSEFAVMGFEYGYSLASPDSLNIWEAQFGDFANGAQVLVDQFLSAGESKWQRMSDLILMLPHGYEGQGPEHSSARLERYLQNSAEYNWSVVNITDPANYFHCLRRQLKRDYRKPLIVMTPKSGLRHPRVISSLEKLTEENGRFQEIIDDEYNVKQAADVKRVLFCSGKIYFDLIDYKENHNRNDVAIVRVEQLYPLDYKTMDELMAKYKHADKCWIQEEPANMGTWSYILSCYRTIDWKLVSRKSSASPATGFKKVHEKEQQQIIETAFSI